MGYRSLGLGGVAGGFTFLAWHEGLERLYASQGLPGRYMGFLQIITTGIIGIIGIILG